MFNTQSAGLNKKKKIYYMPKGGGAMYHQEQAILSPVETYLQMNIK